MKSVWLHENKWEDVEAYLRVKKTVIVPFGSVEQHAKHLPMGTDTFVALRIAEDAGKETNTLVVPPTWFGFAPHHMAYPGTITFRAETLTNVILRLLRLRYSRGLTQTGSPYLENSEPTLRSTC